MLGSKDKRLGSSLSVLLPLMLLYCGFFAEAYMMPPPMSPYGMTSPMNPYNPSGYHIVRRRRRRGLLKRMFNVGPKYRYRIQPNYYSMYGRPPMGMGMPGMGMGMPGMGMGMPGMGMPGMGMGVPAVGMSSMAVGMPAMGATGVMRSSTMYSPMMPQAAVASMYTSPMLNPLMGSATALSMACRSHDTLSLRSVNCGAMLPQDLSVCFRTAIDPLLSALVRKCKSVLGKNPYQLAANAVELILANKPMAFGHLITRGTCAIMGVLEMDLMLKAAVSAHTHDAFSYVDYILSTCRVSPALMVKYQTRALLKGNRAAAFRLQQATLYPFVNNIDRQPTIVYLPSGRIINLRFSNALALLTGRDMESLGKIGKLCSFLTAEHLTNPYFPTDLLAEMNENCFRQLQPYIFYYFTNSTIRKLRWWRSARPEQISKIMIGPPIQAVPFYLLGMHSYINTLDRYHPCHGITKLQRASIMMNRQAARAFYERCRASSAMALKASAWILVLSMAAVSVLQAVF